MRMVALGQAWLRLAMEPGSPGNAIASEAAQRSAVGSVVLLAAELPMEILQPHVAGFELRQLATAGDNIGLQAEEVLSFAAQRQAAWLAIDSYQIGMEAETCLVNSAAPILMLDDSGGAARTFAEVTVTPHSVQLPWTESFRETGGWQMAGLKFVPVREEFRRTRKTTENRPISSPENPPGIVTITMGAADPERVAQKIAAALSACTTRGPLTIRILTRSDRVSEVFANSGLVISAGGSTLYDLACLGIPSIAVGIADNQKIVIESMVAAGATVAGGWSTTLGCDRILELTDEILARTTVRQRMREAGRALVDGEGADRIVARMLAGKLRMRPAVGADSEGLFTLRNDEQVRANSRTTGAVVWPTHREWLERTLADPLRALWVLVDDRDRIVGQSRMDFDSASGSGTISIALDGTLRGKSVASGFLRKTILASMQDGAKFSGMKEVHAEIRHENLASRQLFHSLGFLPRSRGESDRSEDSNRSEDGFVRYRLELPAG